MKKISDKLLKIIMLIGMIFSSLQTPIYVLADELNSTSSDGSTPLLEKGDMKLGEDGVVTKTGTVSTTSKSTDGKISVKKTVTKDETVEGRFKVDFEIVGKESEESTPVYVVLVFDRSGSMCDSVYSKCKNMTKWDNATQAAYNFSKIIKDNIPSSKIALVTFSTNASKDRDFEHKYLGSDTDKSIFGTANGGTNLHDGLIKAKEYLDDPSIPKGAKKYVVVMSDGKPTYYIKNSFDRGGNGEDTTTNILNATLKEAKSIKDSGIEIYSIGYSLSEDNILGNYYKYDSKKDFTNYTDWKAKDVLKNVASADTDTSKDAISHYQDASNSDKIKDAFEKIATNIVLPGKEAVLTDNIGNNFKFVSQLDNSVGGTNSTSNSNGFGGTYISNEITKITKDSIKFSFNIDIDKDSPTGWYQTNNGFNLVYKDNNGNEQTIESDKDPYVYWVQNEYDYIVNYYKDSIADGNLFKSDTRKAPKGTVINESNVLKDKYLSEAGVAYEYDSISPESITITNDGETKVINVLYVKVYGTLKVSYVDTEGKDLLPSKSETKEVGTDYNEVAPSIYGYTLVDTIGSTTGTYVKGITEIKYVYSKNAGNVPKNEVVKTQTNAILGANSTFKYTLTYNGEIENYVGDATLTLTDTLPYDVKSISYDTENCTFDDSTRTLTCTKNYDITETNRVINEVFTFEVVYKGLVSELELNVKNEVNSKLTFGDTENTAHGETTDKVLVGTVIAKYVDEDGKELADSVTKTGLGDSEYKTSEKTIYGYTLKGQPENKNGKYAANETIYVIYVYTKNAGEVTENKVTKTGPENITSVNGTFNYTLTYNGKIEDYVGKATLTLTDILPYELENGSKYEGCTYSNKVLTCVKEFDIDKEHQEVSAKFDLELVFKDVDSNIVVNKVDSLLTYGNNNEPGTSETETEVFKGTVVAIYKNRDGELLTENIVSTGLAGSDYDTEELEFLGYTLTKLPENKSGKYVANQTTTVVYIYDKNVGTSEEHLEKTGFEMVDGVDSAFEYKITYNLEVFDYVGDVNITLTDYLPFDIDLDKSDLGNVCKYNNGLLICEYKHTINSKEDSVINIEEDLVLYYKDIDTNKVVNRIESLVVYGDEKKFDEDEFITEIPYGQIKVNYVTEDGKELSSSEISIGLVGADYKTNEKYFDDYYLKEVIGNEEGKYEAEEQEITYVYSEIPLPPQTGINSNNMDYLGILVFAIVVLIIKKRYA